MERVSIKKPELLYLDGGKYFGGSQEWYDEFIKRRSGCGPVACCHIMMYLAMSRQGLLGLAPYNCQTRQGFLSLMEDMWGYVTPGRMGVNSTKMFIEGAVYYGRSKGISLSHSVMEISPRPSLRPSKQEMGEFMQKAMQNDLPVAFLNLSNGALANLDNWHWVTITAFHPQRFTAQMCDQGKQYVIEMDTWLKTTLMGGGLVTIGLDAI